MTCIATGGWRWVFALALTSSFLGGGVQSFADEKVEWMTIDPEQQSVHLTIVAAADGHNGTLNFNGYARDELTITVPFGWKVEVEFLNKGLGALPHSLAVTEETNPIPIEDGTVAFPRATTVKLVEGLAPGESDTFSFRANREGRFLLFCGVPNHGVGGMWNYFVVSKAAALPGISIKKEEPKLSMEYDGFTWKAMTEPEKMAFLSGFLAGAALEQAVASLGPGTGQDVSVKSALAALQTEKRLRFPFSPSVYKSQLEDFYFYQDRLSRTLPEAIFEVNQRLRRKE